MSERRTEVPRIEQCPHLSSSRGNEEKKNLLNGVKNNADLLEKRLHLVAVVCLHSGDALVEERTAGVIRLIEELSLLFKKKTHEEDLRGALLLACCGRILEEGDHLGMLRREIGKTLDAVEKTSMHADEGALSPTPLQEDKAISRLSETFDETPSAKQDVILIAGLHLEGAMRLAFDPLHLRRVGGEEKGHLVVVKEFIRGTFEVFAVSVASLEKELKSELFEISFKGGFLSFSRGTSVREAALLFDE